VLNESDIDVRRKMGQQCSFYCSDMYVSDILYGFKDIQHYSSGLPSPREELSYLRVYWRVWSTKPQPMHYHLSSCICGLFLLAFLPCCLYLGNGVLYLRTTTNKKFCTIYACSSWVLMKPNTSRWSIKVLMEKCKCVSY
jgi:hypothetical protein